MPHAPIPFLLATRNRKKGVELLKLIAPPWEPDPVLGRLQLETLADYPELAETIEDAPTFAGNARKKASAAALATGRWVLADDSGLAVSALDGAPGVHSARYAGTHGDDAANNQKLLVALRDVPTERRDAAFHCALAVADPDGSIQLEASGICRGRITHEARGSAGFGYDPYFLIPELHQTFGQLSALVKHQLSHRSRAFQAIRPALSRLLANSFPSK